MSKKEKLKHFLSWAFNNAGNKIDRQRLHIIDGTPLHSTGLQRELYNTTSLTTFGITASGVLLTLAMRNNPEQAKDIFRNIVALPAIIYGSLKLWDMVISKRLRKQYGDICFNTAPDENAQTKPDLYLFAQQQKDGERASPFMLLGIMGVLYGIDLLKDDQPLIDMAGTTIAFGIIVMMHSQLNCQRFGKVLDGGWTIEDTPPQQKKPAREPLSDKFKRLLPVPQPAMAPVRYASTLPPQHHLILDAIP